MRKSSNLFAYIIVTLLLLTILNSAFALSDHTFVEQKIKKKGSEKNTNSHRDEIQKKNLLKSGVGYNIVTGDPFKTGTDPGLAASDIFVQTTGV